MIIENQADVTKAVLSELARAPDHVGLHPPFA
jgi:hypothetical protein